MSNTPQDEYQIVVGFDDSEGARRALTWAADANSSEETVLVPDRRSSSRMRW